MRDSDTESSGEEDELSSLSGSDSPQREDVADDAEMLRHSRKRQNRLCCTKWAFTATFHFVVKLKLSTESAVASAVKNFKAKLAEANKHLGKRFLTYILVVYHRDSVQLLAQEEEADDESLYSIPVRGYLECKLTTVEHLRAMMPEECFPDIQWTGLQTDLDENPQYLQDMSQSSIAKPCMEYTPRCHRSWLHCLIQTVLIGGHHTLCQTSYIPWTTTSITGDRVLTFVSFVLLVQHIFEDSITAPFAAGVISISLTR